MDSRDTRAHFWHAQTVSKQLLTANNELAILRGDLGNMKKAEMPKRQLIYTTIKRLFNNTFQMTGSLLDFTEDFAPRAT